MFSKYSVAFGLLAILLTSSHFASVECVEGRLFFLAYMNISTDMAGAAAGIQEIFISCVNVDGKVRVQYLPMNQSRVIQLNSTNNWQYTVNIYDDLAGPLGTQLPASIIISSQMDISVQTNKAEDGTGEGYLALPITRRSTEFYLGSYTPRGTNSYLSIASPYDTCVEVQVYNDTDHYREMFIAMPAGTTFHASFSVDATGFYITSRKPIAVYGGMDCAYIPDDVPATQLKSCDHIIEQIPPLYQLGTSFILSSFYGRNPSAGFQYRVVPTNTTTVRRIERAYDPNTKQPQAYVPQSDATVKRGQWAEFTSGRGSDNPTVVLLTCSIPCLVMQYNPGFDTPKNSGTEPDNSRPDEFMITVPGLARYTNDMTFSTSKYYTKATNVTGDFKSGITLVAKNSDLPSIMLDGTTAVTSITGAELIDVNFPMSFQATTETYTVIYAPITPGYHKVTSTTGANFTVYVYGAAPSTSNANTGYGYLAGFKYKDDDIPITSGPWFDFTSPTALGVQPPTATNTSLPPVPDLVPDDYPIYATIWEAKFYTLVPSKADLKTRNCSEAYYKYYLEERFEPMKQRLNRTFIPALCASGLEMNMTHLLYYSEFTDGFIRFSLTMTSPGSATARQIFDCIALVADYISEYKSWYPGYRKVTDFLKNDAAYTRGCDILHMDTPKFQSEYFGWQCPTKGGLLGTSSAVRSATTTSLVRHTCLVLMLLLLNYVR